MRNKSQLSATRRNLKKCEFQFSLVARNCWFKPLLFIIPPQLLSPIGPLRLDFWFEVLFWLDIMADRLHSSHTLLEGMNTIQFGDGHTDGTRKRELEESIRAPQLSIGDCCVYIALLQSLGHIYIIYIVPN